MNRNERRAAAGEVVSYFATEEAVYLKVAVDDGDGRHLGWARGVKIDRETLQRYLRVIDQRLNEALQMTLPWDENEVSRDNVKWMPPQP